MPAISNGRDNGDQRGHGDIHRYWQNARQVVRRRANSTLGKSGSDMRSYSLGLTITRGVE